MADSFLTAGNIGVKLHMCRFAIFWSWRISMSPRLVTSDTFSSTAVYLVAAAPCKHWPNILCSLCR
eukprot:4541309-Ditylum_brightwellii.AAC.1